MESVEEELHQRLHEACGCFVGEKVSPEMISRIKAKCVAIIHSYVDELNIKCLAIDCYEAGGGQVWIRAYVPDL